MVVLLRGQMHRFAISAAAAIAIFGFAHGSAQAKAALADVEGNVLVNSGTGYRVPVTATLNTGDRIMVGSNASATIRFDDGCTVPLSSGLITVGSKSPCAVRAQGVSVPASVTVAANNAAASAAASGLTGQAAASSIASAAAQAASAAGLTGQAAASAVATAAASAASSAGIAGVTAATAAASAAAATGVAAGTTVAVDGALGGGLLGSFSVTTVALAGGAVVAVAGTVAVIANDKASP